MFVQTVTSGGLGFGKPKICTKNDMLVKRIRKVNQKSTLGLEKLIDALVNVEKREVQSSQSWFNMGVAFQSFSKVLAEDPDMNHDGKGELSAEMGNIARGVEQISNLCMKKVEVVSLTEPLLELQRTGPAVEAILDDRTAALWTSKVARRKLEHKKKPQGTWDQDDFLITEEHAEKADAELKELTLRVLEE